MQNLRILASLMGALGAVAIAGCSDSSSDSGTLHVRNDSDFAIIDIKVTPVGSTTWGPNLIDGEVLEPGQSLLIDVSCDRYDAMLTDDSGAQCTLHDVDVCLNTTDWIIQNDDCPVFAAAQAARQAQAAGSSTAH